MSDAQTTAVAPDPPAPMRPPTGDWPRPQYDIPVPSRLAQFEAEHGKPVLVKRGRGYVSVYLDGSERVSDCFSGVGLRISLSPQDRARNRMDFVRVKLDAAKAMQLAITRDCQRSSDGDRFPWNPDEFGSHPGTLAAAVIRIKTIVSMRLIGYRKAQRDYERASWQPYTIASISSDL